MFSFTCTYKQAAKSPRCFRHLRQRFPAKIVPAKRFDIRCVLLNMLAVMCKVFICFFQAGRDRKATLIRRGKVPHMHQVADCRCYQCPANAKLGNVEKVFGKEPIIAPPRQLMQWADRAPWQVRVTCSSPHSRGTVVTKRNPPIISHAPHTHLVWLIREIPC